MGETLAKSFRARTAAKRMRFYRAQLLCCEDFSASALTTSPLTPSHHTTPTALQDGGRGLRRVRIHNSPIHTRIGILMFPPVRSVSILVPPTRVSPTMKAPASKSVRAIAITCRNRVESNAAPRSRQRAGKLHHPFLRFLHLRRALDR